MDRLSVLGDTDLLISAAAGLSVVAAILVLVWPVIVPDRTAARLGRLKREQQRIRQSGRQDGNGARLVLSPGALYPRIVAAMRLDKGVEETRLAATLRMAGYRGKGPIYAYLAARSLLPLVGLAGAAVYVYLVMTATPALTMQIAILAAAAGAGHYAPALYIKNRIVRRRTAITRAWPNALDLLLICIEAGMTIEAALRRVAEEIGFESVDLAEEIGLTVAELSYLQNRETAYRNFGARTGSYSIRAVTASMMQSEKFGTSIGNAIRVLAKEQRDQRTMLAEKKAAALPPKLTVPMIVFFLPVLFIVILTPAVIEVLSNT